VERIGVYDARAKFSEPIERADAADYEKDMELFQASLEFVKAARSR
jgi:hypothetical protein